MVASAEAKPSAKQKKESKTLSLACHKKPVFCGNFRSSTRDGPRRFPKGDRKAPRSPPQRRNPLRNRKKKVSSFPLPSARNLFLVRGFVRLRADEVLSITGKYPKGAGGGQRVHGTWPPPDPPLLRNSAPLASQGRAQRSSHPFPGGPLSPSAQSIPPPAPGRRFIPGVMARDCHGRDTLGEGLPRLIGRARHGPNAAHGGLEEVAYSPCPCPARANLPPPWRQYFLAGNPFPPGNSPVFPFTNGGFSATMKRSALEPCARAADHSDGVLGGRR